MYTPANSSPGGYLFGDQLAKWETDTLSQGLDAVSVSYTHLRAHETVLDLVCRLLLEKKKQHKLNMYLPALVRLTIKQYMTLVD